MPGFHDTDRASAIDAVTADAEGIDAGEAKKQRCAAIPAGRYGSTAEFGAMCAFLCSQHVGYIVGQNILLDGGAVNTIL